MRGVHCSWVEMKKIQREIEAADGKCESIKRVRCVSPVAITLWKRAIDVMHVIEDDGKLLYHNFSSFQPHHAATISQHFRKTHGKVWDSDVHEKIVDWVHRCETEELTVEQLRTELKGPDAGFDYLDELGKLWRFVSAMSLRFPVELLPRLCGRLQEMADEILLLGRDDVHRGDRQDETKTSDDDAGTVDAQMVEADCENAA